MEEQADVKEADELRWSRSNQRLIQQSLLRTRRPDSQAMARLAALRFPDGLDCRGIRRTQSRRTRQRDVMTPFRNRIHLNTTPTRGPGDDDTDLGYRCLAPDEPHQRHPAGGGSSTHEEIPAHRCASAQAKFEAPRTQHAKVGALATACVSPVNVDVRPTLLAGSWGAVAGTWLRAISGSPEKAGSPTPLGQLGLLIDPGWHFGRCLATINRCDTWSVSVGGGRP